MKTTDQRFQVVLVSPGDVAIERVAAQSVVDQLNRGVAAHRLWLWHWDTDAHPSLCLAGPGRVDEKMDICDADVVVGVFWKRLGTSTGGSRLAVEHELRAATAAWKESGSPDVIVVFCTRAYSATTLDELAQRVGVLEFRRALPKEQPRSEYECLREFEVMLRERLTDFVRKRPPAPRDRAPVPISAWVSSESVHGGPASGRISADSRFDAPDFHPEYQPRFDAPNFRPEYHSPEPRGRPVLRLTAAVVIVVAIIVLLI